MTLQLARERLSETGWLSQTSRSFQNAVLARCNYAHFPRGAYIYRLADPMGPLYGIAEGRVMVEVLPPGDDPIVGDLLPPGSWLGAGAIASQQARMVGVRAASDCAALVLPPADLRRIMEVEDQAWRWLALLCTLNLDRAMLCAMNLMIRDPRERILAVLQRLCGTIPRAASDPVAVDLDLAQDELARMANVSRTLVGEYLRELEVAGHASQSYRRITIGDPSHLR